MSYFYNIIKMSKSKKEVLLSQMSQQHSENSQKSNPDKEDSEVEEGTAPRIDRNLTYETDQDHVIINTAFTHYPVVREVAASLEMTVIDEPGESNWDVCWTDALVTPHTFIRMHFHQSINYVPGVYKIARKNQLGRHLNLMRHHFPLDYNFHPPTWMLPNDFHLLRKHLETEESKGQVFIVKPEADCQGRGIFLIQKLEQIRKGKHCVVQRYVPNPLLINGYKFDLRVYVLIGSIDPLRIYIFNDGLGRFATQTYSSPNQSNFKDNFQHLTNYAINKLNPKFKAAQSGDDGEGGFKRSLQAVMKLLKQMGADTELLWTRIKQISVKTIITSYQQIRHNYVKSHPQQYHNRMAFHILGLDILINDNLEPVLLEVNHKPSFATETPLDHRIKFALIRDALILMRCDSVQLKNELFAKSKLYSSNRIVDGIRECLNEQVRKQQIAKNAQQRLQFEKTHLGGYEVIFPSQDEQQNSRFNLLIDRAKAILYSKPTKGQEQQQKQALKKDNKQKNEQREIRQGRERRESYQLREQRNLMQYSLKNSEVDILKREEIKSIKQAQNHSMYNERFRPETQVIQKDLKSVSKKQTQNIYQRPLLFNIQSKNTRTFTIKTKHSNVDIHRKSPILEEPRKEKEKLKPVFRRHMVREGNFLKPKTYDVPTLVDMSELKSIHKKNSKSIHF